MNPDFALSLAQDGLRLLHRTRDGWECVASAQLTEDDLAARLEAMRAAAADRDPDPLRCKVVIPDDQIKYLTVPFASDAEQTEHETAREALTGATPYDVGDLAFDTHVKDGQLQIAAVARETLAEAQGFASQNGFDPVTLVADPPADEFFAEPVFATMTENGLNAQTGRKGSEWTHPISRDTVTVQPTETELEETEAVESDVSFVSRRTVPTFRTEPEDEPYQSDDARAAGFAEPSASYTSAPLKTRPRATAEAQKMTVFGARDESLLAGRRESLKRVAAVVIVVSLGIAGTASGMFSKGWNAVFDGSAGPAPELRFAAPLQPDQPTFSQPQPASLPKNDPPAREPVLSDEDAAVLDALATPIDELPDTETTATASPPAPKPEPDDILAYYAVYGIWPKAPDVPTPTDLVDLTDVYTPLIDSGQPVFDAVALQDLASYQRDEPLLAPLSPAPAGTQFTLDAQGLVVPTPEGAINADGIPVFAGAPPVRPPNTLIRVETPGDNLERRLRLSAFRPVARPDNLIPEPLISAVGAERRAELALLRPRLRPVSVQESAAAAASLVALDSDGALIREAETPGVIAPNARAVKTSLRPDARPDNFAAIVARAQRAAPAAQPAATAALVAPRTVTPAIPSSASTAREATQRNAINLRKVNLIGVYGTPSSRRALVRLGNGRYQKVAVGDRIDGGRVSAIGESELRYQKSGRAVVLKMPRG